MVLAAGWQSQRLIGWSGPVDGSPTLAVIPMVTHGDAGEARFRDRLGEALPGEIEGASAGSIGVVPWRWGMSYDRAAGVVEEGGLNVGIDFILEGTVRRERGDFLISLYIFRARDGTMMWTESFRRSTTETTAAVREISRSMAGAATQSAPP